MSPRESGVACGGAGQRTCRALHRHRRHPVRPHVVCASPPRRRYPSKLDEPASAPLPRPCLRGLRPHRVRRPGRGAARPRRERAGLVGGLERSRRRGRIVRRERGGRRTTTPRPAMRPTPRRRATRPARCRAPRCGGRGPDVPRRMHLRVVLRARYMLCPDTILYTAARNDVPVRSACGSCGSPSATSKALPAPALAAGHLPQVPHRRVGCPAGRRVALGRRDAVLERRRHGKRVGEQVRVLGVRRAEQPGTGTRTAARSSRSRAGTTASATSRPSPSSARSTWTRYRSAATRSSSPASKCDQGMATPRATELHADRVRRRGRQRGGGRGLRRRGARAVLQRRRARSSSVRPGASASAPATTTPSAPRGRRSATPTSRAGSHGWRSRPSAVAEDQTIRTHATTRA